MNPPMQDDDGFGDFRAKVKDLPPEQRRAALTQMEQAIIENLRTNMLADLYEDQPPPAPEQRQPPTGDSNLDSRLGRTSRDAVDFDSPDYRQYLKEYEDELRAGGMTPENDPQSWRAAMDEAYMGYDPNRSKPEGTTPMRQPMPMRSPAPMQQRQPTPQPTRRMAPSIIDEPEPEALSMVQPTKFQTPQGGRPQMSDQQMQDRGRTVMGPDGKPQPAWAGGEGFVDENDPDLPPYASPLPQGSMKGKPYPSEKDFGGKTDSWVSEVYRWEKDNGAFGLEFDSPEYKKFIQDYMTKMQGGGSPNARGAFAVPPGRRPTHPIGAF